MGAVAQQAQSDVHADLGAAAGEERAAAGEVGAGVALGVAERGALRAELVVERVDLGVLLLADVARARLEQLAGDGGPRAPSQRDARRERDAAGLVVDAVGGSRRGRGNDGAVGFRDLGPLLKPAILLDGFEHPCGRLSHGDEIRMLLVECVHRGEHAQHGVEVCGVDAPRLDRSPLFLRHRTILPARAKPPPAWGQETPSSTAATIASATPRNCTTEICSLSTTRARATVPTG